MFWHSLVRYPDDDERPLGRLGGKRPLFELVSRPANYETPLKYFRSALTPTDAFYVRSHGTPPKRRSRAWRLGVTGNAGKTATVRLGDLRDLPPASVTAVCYCAGNRRAYFPEKAPGVPWRDGGMSCALWRGARLKDVLALAGAPAGDAIELFMAGADTPSSDVDAPFVKSLPLWKAMEDDVLLAYEMNGEALPAHNGGPVRVVVPGWTATYWVKHLSSLTLSAAPFVGHWMSTDYRVPRDSFGIIERFASQESETSEPLTEIQVNALVLDVRSKRRAPGRHDFDVQGIAWDGGYGVSDVSLSSDGGTNWMPARLGPSEGRFAYRPWRSILRDAPPSMLLMVRATNARGQTQPIEPTPNPFGYYYNAVQRVALYA